MRALALASLITLLAGCPATEDTADTDVGTDTDTDTSVDTEVDTEPDTEFVSGLTEWPDPAGCEPWGSTPPAYLSLTGCVDRADPSMPASGLMPYAIVSPLWSDDADKDRYIAMPTDSTITVDQDGDFDFPVGTVLAKWFTLEDQLLEVRLYARGGDGWSGASWEWDEQAQDGVLRTQGATVTLPSGTQWDIPSQGQCRQCHTAAANTNLGPEVAQLDFEWTYPSGVIARPLDTFRALGMIDGPLPEVAELADPFGDADLGLRARSYLHSNCAGCHQPGGGTPYNMDLRIWTDFADAATCGVNASNSLGLADMERIAPGDPEHTMLLQRMGNEALRMPPVGSTVVDDAAIDLISEWVTSLSDCESGP